ncbi:hypothetical protein RvY_18381 [Ramazzottius varieornatus]|uniref:Uncharacterized protein n=1 Tax=Ramazzottius varieornatus TaxID=947166 RepID=A0A1D1W5I2_RAMVA|nr:hypothetical protein RvY_18381 [Ramazzottius varieornatus]
MDLPVHLCNHTTFVLPESGIPFAARQEHQHAPLIIAVLVDLGGEQRFQKDQGL